MKNKSINFNVLNWFEASQAEIVKLQHAVKAAAASAAMGTYVGSDIRTSVAVAAIGALLCEIIGCLRIEDKN